LGLPCVEAALCWVLVDGVADEVLLVG
jgi:hypothetical protein